MMDKSHELAARLKTAREFSGLSQSQVAEKIGLHRPTISEIEAGRRKVDVDEVKKFADIYNVDLLWLMNGEEHADISDKVSLAARELNKLNPEDLEKLLEVIKILRK